MTVGKYNQVECFVVPNFIRTKYWVIFI